MEYLLLSVLITLFVVFMAYQRNPRFRASMNRTSNIAMKRFMAWWHMQWHKRRLWQVDRVKAKQAAQLKRMNELIAKDYKLSTGKEWKGAHSANHDKGQENKGQKQAKPNELAIKRAWAEFMLYTLNWTELDCYQDVLNLLAVEAQARAKKKNYSLEILKNKTAIIYNAEDEAMVQINTTTGEIKDLRVAMPAPVVRQNKAPVFEADNSKPAPRKELEPPYIPPRSDWELEQEANRA